MFVAKAPRPKASLFLSVVELIYNAAYPISVLVVAILALCILCFALPSFAWGQPIDSRKDEAFKMISLADALKIADTYNPQLLVGRENIDLNKADIGIAGEIPNPQVTATYGVGTVTTILGSPQQVGVNETFETDGKRHKRVQAAKAQFKLTLIQFESLRWDIRSQVRRAYTELAAAEENARSLDAQARLLQQLVDIARKRYQAGVAPESEVLQAKLSRSQIETQRNQARGRIEQARLKLNNLLGNRLASNFEISDQGIFRTTSYSSPKTTHLVPQPQLPLPSIRDLYSKAGQDRLDLKAAIQQAKVSDDQLILVKSQRIPDVQLGLGYSFIRAPSPTSATNSKAFFDGEYLMATVDLPIFHNQQSEMMKAKATIVQNNLQVIALRSQIHLEIDTAYSALKVAQKNINLYQNQLLPSARDVLHLSQESYEMGKTGLTNVILAEQTVQQILSSYLDAIIAYQDAWSDLEKAVGGPIIP